MSLPIRYDLSKRVCDAYFVKDAKSSELHGHHHFLITFIVKGRGIQILNGEEIHFSAGDMFILSAADFHKNIIADGESYDYYGVKFPYELLNSGLADMCGLDRFPIHLSLGDKTAKRIQGILEILVEESGGQERGKASDILMRALVEELFILAVRELPEKSEKRAGTFINRALGFLHSNFHTQISVADAAAYVGYTENYFNTLFRESFGSPFATYLRKMRINYAKNMLLSGNPSLTEIALESGFASLSHFSRIFKGEYGISPQEYRKKHRDD